jgi:hypothetical protein
MFLKEHSDLTRVVFVDDNSDNAWKMFEYFASAQLSGIS